MKHPLNKPDIPKTASKEAKERIKNEFFTDISEKRKRNEKTIKTLKINA